MSKGGSMSESQLLTAKDLPTIKKLADKFHRCVANGNITPLVQVGVSAVFLRKNGLIMYVQKEDECAGR